jgi:hypothetical protein
MGSKLIPDSITPEMVLALFKLQDGRCAVSSERFNAQDNLALHATPNEDPKGPVLYRLDSRKPYNRGECFLVCKYVVPILDAFPSMFEFYNFCSLMSAAKPVIFDTSTIQQCIVNDIIGKI